jgi:hypothetical protein
MINNSALTGCAVPSTHSGTVAGAVGTGLFGGAPLPLVRHRNVFTAWPRMAPAGTAMAAAAQQATTLQKYQDTTRIAAADGSTSGSHPAWDPV